MRLSRPLLVALSVTGLMAAAQAQSPPLRVVWVTGPGGIWVISVEGQHLGTIRVPENTGNLAWGGEDWHTLYIPSSTSLYAIKTIVGPRREPYMR